MSATLTPFPRDNEPTGPSLSNPEIEGMVLGAMMVNPAVLDRLTYLRADHFAFSEHQRIFTTLVERIGRGDSVAPAALEPYLGDIKPFGTAAPGDNYLTHLFLSVFSVSEAESYAREVRDLAHKRLLRDQALRMLADLRTDSRPAAELIAETGDALNMIGDDSTDDGHHLQHVGIAINEAMEQSEGARRGVKLGLETGIQSLDTIFSGFEPGMLYILAGRPSMGKSALAWQFALNVARREHGVAFFSLEMSNAQLGHRTLSEIGGVPYHDLRQGNYGDLDVAALNDASASAQALPLFVRDRGAKTVQAIEAEARRLMRRQPIRLLIVDYLQLVEAATTYRGNKVAEVTEISGALKGMAKKLNVPVLALSQLSRQLESREDKRPMLSDLRESGAIEQDADAVMFVFREQYYLERSEPTDAAKQIAWQAQMDLCINVAEVIIAKQRMGPVKSVSVFFDAARNRFRPLWERG